MEQRRTTSDDAVAAHEPARAVSVVAGRGAALEGAWKVVAAILSATTRAMSRPSRRPLAHRGRTPMRSLDPTTRMVGLDPVLSRRALVRGGAAGGGALMLGGLVGGSPGQRAARAQESGSLLYGDFGAAAEVIAAAERAARLDRVGALDVSTGLVAVDPDGLKDALSGELSGRRLERAYAAYLRHAELGFAVGGSPEAVATGRDVCVPWWSVE
jgi:hypothetical protein